MTSLASGGTRHIYRQALSVNQACIDRIMLQLT